LNESDAPFVLQLYNTEGFLRFVGDKKIHSTHAARQYIVDGPVAMYQSKGIGLYLAEHKTTAAPLGVCGLLKRDSLQDVDLGYGFLPEYSGCGYALEAAEAVIQFARKQLKLASVVAMTSADNVRSKGLLSKLGFSFVETIEDPEQSAIIELYRVGFQP